MLTLWSMHQINLALISPMPNISPPTPRMSTNTTAYTAGYKLHHPDQPILHEALRWDASHHYIKDMIHNL